MIRFDLGRLFCRLGHHDWSLPYPHAGDESWWGGAGHHRCHCKREGCSWVKRWQPGTFPNNLKTAKGKEDA